MTNELTVYDRVQDPLVYAERMGTSLHRSGMYGIANEHAGAVIVMTCMSEGMSFMDFGRRYHMIKGRPSMRADAMLAEFRMNWGGEFEPIESTSKRAAIRVAAKNGHSKEYEFTWEQAKDSRWPWKDWKTKEELKDNWATPEDRETMLWARLVSKTLRRVCPELVAGIYTPEEIEDLDLPEVEAPKPRITAEEAGEILRGNAENAGFAEHILDSDQAPADRTGLVTDLQEARINGLFDQLEVPTQDRLVILQKRGVQSLGMLTFSQADELIEKLQAKYAEAKN